MNGEGLSPLAKQQHLQRNIYVGTLLTLCIHMHVCKDIQCYLFVKVIVGIGMVLIITYTEIH